MVGFPRSNWWRLLSLIALIGAGVWWILIPWYIYENGSSAQARVLEVWSTSTTINDEPLIGLLLEVRPANGTSFEIERHCRWSVENDWLFQTGAQVEVRFDPRFLGRVVMASADCDQVFSAMWLTGLGTVGFILLTFMVTPMLAGRFIFNSDLQEKGIPADATVLKVWDTNVEINDQPQVGVLLHLRSETGETFDVESKLVVGHTSLGSLYSGAELKVKYDQRKPSRLVVMSYDKPVERKDTAARLEKLEKLRTQGLIFEEEYQQIRKTILDDL